MKTNKTIAYGLFAVILARHGWRCLSALAGVFSKKKLLCLLTAWMLLVSTGCPEPTPTHTHDYGTEWSSNATQHWHECSCGDKTDVADHSGDPCAICGYASGSQNPDLCECNGNAEDCDCEDCDCEVCEEEPPVNQPPTANAGTDQTVTLADNLTITLDGTDSTGNISAYAWECESYTADQGTVSAEYTKVQVNALITNADTATATVKPRKAGTYVFKLTVTGNDSESDTDTVTVVVEGLSECTVEFVSLAASFPSPTINFSPSTTLPTGVTYILRDDRTPQNSWNSAEVFNGQITAADYYVGVNNQVTFTQTFYFNDVKITGANSDRTVVITAGTSATTRFVTSNSDTGSVTLKWTEILPLAANAKAESTHTLADNLTITLDGTDSTGNISAYAWECESYTADQGTVSEEYSKAQVNALITNANAKTATVKPRKAGTYKFKLTVTGKEGESDTDTVTVVVEGYTNIWTETVDVTVAEVTTSLPSMTLNIELPSNNYSFAEQNNHFSSNDLAGITYTLSSINPSKTAQELSTHISNGVLSGLAYNDDATIITQTFYYKGEVVGSRKFQARLDTSSFQQIRAVNDDNSIGTRIDKIPESTLTLSKPMSGTITELP